MRLFFLLLLFPFSAAAQENNFPERLSGEFVTPCSLEVVQTELGGDTCTAEALKALGIEDRPHFVLSEPFAYTTDAATYTVPEGFIVDGSSIPQVVWSVVGGPFSGYDLNASVVHDYYVFICVDGEPSILNDCGTQLSGDHPEAQEVHLNFHEGMLADGAAQDVALVKLFAVCLNKYWDYEDGSQRPRRVYTLDVDDPIRRDSVLALLRGYKIISALFLDPSLQGAAQGISDAYDTPAGACEGARELQAFFNRKEFDAIAEYKIPVVLNGATSEAPPIEAGFEVLEQLRQERDTPLTIVQTDAAGGFDPGQLQRIFGRSALAPEDAIIMLPNLTDESQVAGYRLLSGTEFAEFSVATAPTGLGLGEAERQAALAEPATFTAFLAGQRSPQLASIGMATNVASFATIEGADGYQLGRFGDVTFREGALIQQAPNLQQNPFGDTGIIDAPDFNTGLPETFRLPEAGVQLVPEALNNQPTIVIPRVENEEISLDNSLNDLLNRSVITPGTVDAQDPLPRTFDTLPGQGRLGIQGTDLRAQTEFGAGILQEFTDRGGSVLTVDPSFSDGSTLQLYLSPPVPSR